jgi:hypothetical protein
VKTELELLIRVGKKLDTPLPSGLTHRELLSESLLRIRDKRGTLVPLRANRVQQEFARTCARRNIVLKARQLGITTYVAGRFFIETITRPGTLTVQVAHDQDSAEQIFRIVHRFYQNLAPRLKEGALRTSRANVRQLVFPQLDSEYRVETAADAEAGRGLTIQNLHGSEVARWPGDAAGTLAGLRAAVPPAGQIVLESTPNGAGGCFYDEWQRAEEAGYTRHFFPWWWEPAYVRPDVDVDPLNEDEQALVAAFGLLPEQIAFRREIRTNFAHLARQEFAEDAESCFLASGDCVFDAAGIAARQAEAPESLARRHGGQLLIWLPPKSGGTYVIGVDPAGGGANGDYACAQVLERTTGLQCAELYARLTPRELGERLVALGQEYNEALIAVERNNHGHAVLAHIGYAGYTNIYEQNGQAGWLTTAVSRPEMLEKFAIAVTQSPEVINSSRLLEECKMFVRRADGTLGAAPGAHDDSIMAMAIALAVRERTVTLA